MQHIKILCIGKFKEKYWEDAEKEYLKRLGAFAKVEVICLPEAKLSTNPTAAEMEAAIRKEGESILAKISQRSHLIALCIRGKYCSSEEFSDYLAKKATEGVGEIVFVIGGSNGLSPAVEERADYKLSFSPMTFPHQLARVILEEQIYRAFQIQSGGKYHK